MPQLLQNLTKETHPAIDPLVFRRFDSRMQPSAGQIGQEDLNAHWSLGPRVCDASSCLIVEIDCLLELVLIYPVDGIRTHSIPSSRSSFSRFGLTSSGQGCLYFPFLAGDLRFVFPCDERTSAIQLDLTCLPYFFLYKSCASW